MQTQIPGWRKKIILFLTSQCITLFGSTLVQMAIVWYATMETASGVWVAAFTIAVGIGLFSCVPLPKQPLSKEKASVFADMKTGVRYAFGHRLIGRLLLLYGFFTLLCVPAGFLAGLLVRRVYGDTYWYLTAVELVGFAGMMGGGLLMSTWDGFQSRAKTLLAGLSAFGFLAIGMGASRNFILYLALMLFYGVALSETAFAVSLPPCAGSVAASSPP